MLTPLSHDELLDLAPTALANRRSHRYHGDDLAVPVATFTAEDQELIRKLYRFLQQLSTALEVQGDARERAFKAFFDHEKFELLVGEVGRLGKASYQSNPTPRLARAIHDVRGGGLTTLIGQLELWMIRQHSEIPFASLYFLTRDHLKIMRNALLGLDDDRRNQDLKLKLHGTDLLVEKWQGAEFIFGSREVRLEVDCPHPVDISECCVEFGAVDRILYNLINNACRHAAGETMRLMLFPVPEEEEENLRFVLLNELTDHDCERLLETDLETLFEAGVSTTGSGYGLNVAAKFVSSAFGLPTSEAAVKAGYLGARVLHDEFAIWFHWPIVKTK